MKLNEELISKINLYKDVVGSKLELAEKCNVSRVTITKYCDLLGIDIKIKLRQYKYNGIPGKKFKLSDILNGLHPQYPTSKLRDRLISEGYKDGKCEGCGIDEWNENPISLHTDHIDGNNRNHTLDNLRLLCPNCHSQTATYGAKNIKLKREK
jgi:hypothetical protein